MLQPWVKNFTEMKIGTKFCSERELPDANYIDVSYVLQKIDESRATILRWDKYPNMVGTLVQPNINKQYVVVSFG
jgi:hypothetical protein